MSNELKKNSYEAFYQACMSNNVSDIDSLIARGKHNWNRGLEGACCGGHVYLVEFLMKKVSGRNNESLDWNRGLEGACRGGHLALAELMIGKGANAWNRGLYEACRNGHENLAVLMIKHGANDFTRCLRVAREYKHSDLVDLITNRVCRVLRHSS